jgi:hypothetical protein
MNNEEDNKTNNEASDMNDFNLFDEIIALVISGFLKRFIIHPLFKKIHIFGKAVPIWVFVLVMLLGYDVGFSKESKIKPVYYSMVGVFDTVVQPKLKEYLLDAEVEQKDEFKNTKESGEIIFAIIMSLGLIFVGCIMIYAFIYELFISDWDWKNIRYWYGGYGLYAILFVGTCLGPIALGIWFFINIF